MSRRGAVIAVRQAPVRHTMRTYTVQPKQPGGPPQQVCLWWRCTAQDAYGHSFYFISRSGLAHSGDPKPA
jgi:hypothetical protein